MSKKKTPKLPVNLPALSSGNKFWDRVEMVLNGIQKAGEIAEKAQGTLEKFGKNHPSWYTNGIPSGRPIGLNYAVNKVEPLVDVVDNDGNAVDYRPSSPALALDIRYVNGTVSSNDYSDSTVPIQVTKFANTLRANSGRLANWNVADLFKLSLTYRNIISSLGLLTMAWAASFATNTRDTSVPYVYERAYGISFSSMERDLGNIRDYIRRTINKVTALCPWEMDVVSRTTWLATNVFTDYDGGKPTYIIPAVSRPVSYFNSTAAPRTYVQYPALDGTGTAFSTAQQVMDAIDQMVNDYKGYIEKTSTVADIVRVTEESHPITTAVRQAFFRYTDPDEPTIIPVSDGYIRRQLQNADIAACSGWNATTNKYEDSWCVMNPNVETGAMDIAIELPAALKDDMRKPFVDFLNAKAVDGAGVPDNDIGKQLSITRLVLLPHTKADDEKIYLSYGTEVIIKAGVLAAYRNSTGGIAYRYTKLSGFIGYNVSTDSSAQIPALIELTSIISSIDNAPKIMLYGFGETDGTVYAGGIYWNCEELARPAAFSVSSFHNTANESLYMAQSLKQKRSSFTTGNK